MAPVMYAGGKLMEELDVNEKPKGPCPEGCKPPAKDTKPDPDACPKCHGTGLVEVPQTYTEGISSMWSGMKSYAYLLAMPLWPVFGRPAYFSRSWGFRHVDDFLGKYGGSFWEIPHQVSLDCKCSVCTAAIVEHAKTCVNPSCPCPAGKAALEKHIQTCVDPKCPCPSGLAAKAAQSTGNGPEAGSSPQDPQDGSDQSQNPIQDTTTTSEEQSEKEEGGSQWVLWTL